VDDRREHRLVIDAGLSAALRTHLRRRKQRPGNLPRSVRDDPPTAHSACPAQRPTVHVGHDDKNGLSTIFQSDALAVAGRGWRSSRRAKRTRSAQRGGGSPVLTPV
jgi:hypothetical protein